MGQYLYKIQWLLENKTNAKKLISTLGSKSFDVITTRNYDLKVIDRTTLFLQYSYNLCDVKTKQWIDKQSKNPDVKYFEFIRR